MSEQEAPEPQKYTTPVEDAECLIHEVCTKRDPGETSFDWATRHADAIDGIRSVFGQKKKSSGD